MYKRYGLNPCVLPKMFSEVVIGEKILTVESAVYCTKKYILCPFEKKIIYSKLCLLGGANRIVVFLDFQISSLMMEDLYFNTQCFKPLSNSCHQAS